ncbi:hypothetical protein JessAGP_031 [Caulobacter phage Jess A]|nr:hypothetical protein JessAGP_031 [Caulobacter phage Jess A]QNH91683.1 hypothetical protein SR18_gp032 [Caulobacter phage SR18]WCA46440.1 hypothetical protein [Caulobacter phage RapA]WCD56216.1 hypothetical protein [Caulobacter phage BL94]
MSGIGHNSGAVPHADVLNSTAQNQLKSVIDRVERLNVEKAEILEQIKEVFAEAKGNGFDVKVLKKVIRLRQQDRAKRQEEEAILDLYLSAIGELDEPSPAPAKEKAAKPKAPPPPDDDEDDQV